MHRTPILAELQESFLRIAVKECQSQCSEHKQVEPQVTYFNLAFLKIAEALIPNVVSRMESKRCVVAETQQVTMAEEKASIANAHKLVIPPTAVERQIFSINQRGDIVGRLLIEKYGVDSNMLIRDEGVADLVAAGGKICQRQVQRMRRELHAP